MLAQSKVWQAGKWITKYALKYKINWQRMYALEFKHSQHQHFRIISVRFAWQKTNYQRKYVGHAVPTLKLFSSKCALKRQIFVGFALAG